MPLISVVIPAYNEERSLKILLNKILAVPLRLTRFTIEIIVVDDGSKDKTGEIASTTPGVRYVRQNNQGKGAAVQRGVQEAHGEYLLVQDADLEYEPDDYVRMLLALPSGGQAAIYGSRTQ